MLADFLPSESMATAAADLNSTQTSIAEEDVAEAEAEFETIDKLQVHGINASDVSKLKAVGIATIGQLQMMPQRQILDIKGISEAKMRALLDASRKVVATGFQSGSALLAHRKQLITITTGSKALDDVLGGGIEAGSITEIFGEARTGKTQLCATLCVVSQLGRESGGGEGKVIVVDTEGAFRPERVAEIAEKRFGLDPNTVLDNILVARARSTDEQVALNPSIASLIADDESPYRVVIVDSVTNLFRQEYTGRGELAPRQQLLNRYLGELKKIAMEFRVAVVLTNQVMATPDATFAGADPRKPVGGHVLAHASACRVYMKKGRGNERICRIYQHPSQPEADAVVALTEGGVGDTE